MLCRCMLAINMISVQTINYSVKLLMVFAKASIAISVSHT